MPLSKETKPYNATTQLNQDLERIVHMVVLKCYWLHSTCGE